MKLPARVSLSQTSTDKLRFIKSKTGLTPNILARIAMMLAIRDTFKIDTSINPDTSGQTLNRDVLFGEHADAYQALLTQYSFERELQEYPEASLIGALIDHGVFKMGHVRDITDIISL